jgi:hypothetical protein
MIYPNGEGAIQRVSNRRPNAASANVHPSIELGDRSVRFYQLAAALGRGLK